jgi:ribonuclease P/MRP protein subunit POP1
MAWDMSYMSTIGLFGKENIVQNLLRNIGLSQESLWNERGKRWRAGAVHWTGNLTRRGKNAVTHFIGPATIIWNPQKALDTPEADTPPRQVFIRIHPSAFFETFNFLLPLIKEYTPRPYLQDLRHEIGSIDVTGPDATEALLGVLKPYDAGPKEAHASKFESLLGLRDPASLPLGALLAYSILDPRLKYPPQKIQPPTATDQQVQIKLMEALSAFRKEEELAPYQIFDRDVRFKASKLPSQQSLNRRRGKTAPGTALDPSSIDPPIPIMLLASRNSNETRMPGTWTILLPWKCVQPVWYSLMHYPLSTGTNPLFGGLDEIRQLTFERGQPWFPGDVPGTGAGKAWEARERQARQKVWDGKPKGRRINWESLDLGAGRKGEVGVGWSCGFETLFTLQNTKDSEKNAAEVSDHEMSGVADSGKEKTSHNFELLTDMTTLTKGVFENFLSNKGLGFAPATSIVTVSIRMLGRGVVTPCARVYRLPMPVPSPNAAATQAEVPATEPPAPARTDGSLPANLLDQWLSQRPAKKSNKNKNLTPGTSTTPSARQQALARRLIGPAQPYPSPHPNTDSVNGHPLCPDAADLIGFVTTGAFNLRDGRGEAIASLSAQAAMDEVRRYRNPRDPAARLCVVREAGHAIGWLARWELV